MSHVSPQPKWIKRAGERATYDRMNWNVNLASIDHQFDRAVHCETHDRDKEEHGQHHQHHCFLGLPNPLTRTLHNKLGIGEDTYELDKVTDETHDDKAQADSPADLNVL